MPSYYQTSFFALLLLISLTGCKSESDQTVNPVAEPKADFLIRSSGYAPTAVSFLNLSENANSYAWDFGDSTVSYELSPDHYFLTPGNYAVSLVAIDTVTNRSDTCRKTLTLTSADPVADFTWSGSRRTPAYIRFINNSRNAAFSEWSFSDGRSSTTRAPDILFSESGSYIITLIVFNQNRSESDTARKTLVITPGKMFLDSLVLDSIALPDTLGHTWDPSSGPDIFYNLRDDNFYLQFTSIGDPVVNVEAASLPVSWAAPDSFSITDWDKGYVIELYDEDQADADDRMTTLHFTMNELIGRDGYVSRYPLAKDGFRIWLVIKWM